MKCLSYDRLYDGSPLLSPKIGNSGFWSAKFSDHGAGNRLFNIVGRPSRGAAFTRADLNPHEPARERSLRPFDENSNRGSSEYPPRRSASTIRPIGNHNEQDPIEYRLLRISSLEKGSHPVASSFHGIGRFRTVSRRLLAPKPSSPPLGDKQVMNPSDISCQSRWPQTQGQATDESLPSPGFPKMEIAPACRQVPYLARIHGEPAMPESKYVNRFSGRGRLG